MNDSTSSTETTTTTETTKATGYVDPNPEKPVVVTEPVVDNLGYETPKSDEEKKIEADKKVEADKKLEEEKAAAAEPVKDPVTGYAKKPDEVAKEEVKPGEVAKEEVKPTEELSKEDIDKALGDLYDKEVISDFAVKHKLSKVQLEAYIELRTAEDAKFTKLGKDRVQQVKVDNWNELKNDADFGGENFDKNLDSVEKLMDTYLVNTKKLLTDKGGMLPPYMMKDLLVLHKTLNPTTSLVLGDASKPVEKKEDSALDFYE